MAAASGYFAAMFDANDTGFTQFTVANLNCTTLKKIVDCCYTGRITFDHECVFDIIKAEKDLGFSHIERKCNDYFTDILNYQNCVYSKSFEMICREFTRIHRIQFQRMGVEQLLELLKSNKIEATEETVFSKLKDWIEGYKGDKSKCVPQLIGCIQLDRISGVVRYS